MARKTPTPPPTADADSDSASPDDSPGNGSDNGTADSTADGAASDSAATPPPASQSRFFGWLRSIGISRQPGWIGGVCAGIAARLGIDPVIVRGIFVVAAVLGGPAILLYALAWLLLPAATDRESEGKIHLEQVLRGHFESPVAAILGLVALSMLPITQGFWFVGSSFWGDPVLPSSIGRALWTITVLGALTWFIVWIARRGAAPTSTGTFPPGSAQPGSAQPGSATAATAPAAAFVVPPAASVPEPTESAATTPPPPGAPEADFAAWREQQQKWKAENDDFRRQADEANLRAQAEYRQQRLDAAALAAERHRLWRAANPRLRGSILAIVVGLAAIAGAIGSQLVSTHQVVVGFATATLIVGFAIIVAGTFRRRSGFLSFIAALLVACTSIGAFLPTDRQLLFNSSIDLSTSGKYAILNNSASIYLAEGVDEGELVKPGTVIDLWHGVGETSIEVPRGTSIRVIADVRSGMVLHDSWTVENVTPKLKNDYNQDSIVDEQDDTNGDGVVTLADRVLITQATTQIDPVEFGRGYNSDDSYDFIIGDAATPSATIRLWQGVGNVYIYDAYPEQDGQ
jgi:phage shock protein PspC (stress-responsive transcriptional regulator)